MSVDDIIAKVRKLGGLASAVATKAAPLVEDVSKRSAAAGVSPTGEKWAPRKDGSPALQNAASAVKVDAIDTVVTIKLVDSPTGYAFVQAIQNAKRQIIPAIGEPIPAPISAALQTAAEQTFSEIVGR